MDLLIVGGGVFLGRAVAEEATKRGHKVAVFNRGKTTTSQPKDAEWIRGDRDGDLSELLGRHWDAVVDTSAYFPRQVEHLLSVLGSSIGHYALISSVSAYRDLSRGGISEDGELAGPPRADCEEVTQDTYGPLKAACEAAARSHGGACPILLVRPGILVGPGDPTGRFSYWVRRLARGGDVLAPGDPNAPIQLLDARDLADWLVDRAEERTSGAFNVVGPTMTWAEMLGCAATGISPGSRLIWLDDDFIVAKGVSEWSSLPFYLPKSRPEFSGMFEIDGSLAKKIGLTHRKFTETARDTARWIEKEIEEPKFAMGLSKDREASLLAAWIGRSQME